MTEKTEGSSSFVLITDFNLLASTALVASVPQNQDHVTDTILSQSFGLQQLGGSHFPQAVEVEVSTRFLAEGGLAEFGHDILLPIVPPCCRKEVTDKVTQR